MSLADFITALIIWGWVPQRQRLSARASHSISLSGSGFASSRAYAVIIIPGIQYPHWAAFSLTKDSWIGCNLPAVPRPSIVVIVQFENEDIGLLQENTAFPSTITLHAPHCSSPHPSLVPFRPRSFLSTYIRGVLSSTSSWWSQPLTLILILATIFFGDFTYFTISLTYSIELTWIIFFLTAL